jgi:hypothetical protein
LSLPQTIVTDRDHAESVPVPAGDVAFVVDQARVAEIVAMLKVQPNPIFTTQKSRETVMVRDCYIDRHLVTN